MLLCDKFVFKFFSSALQMNNDACMQMESFEALHNKAARVGEWEKVALRKNSKYSETL